MREEVRDFTPNEAVLFGQGLEQEGPGGLDNAERLYRSVLVVDPKHFHALFRLGTLLAGKKEYYESLYRLDRACKLNKKDDLALANRGMVLAELGHLDEAAVDFERALHIDPNNYVTLANYGLTLERLERFEEALKLFDRSLAIHPTDDVTQHNRGVTLFRLGRIEEASAACDTTLNINPDYHQARYNRGLCKLYMGDLVNGFADCEVTDLDPTLRKPLFGPFKKPQWQGEGFNGKTVILTGEQGIGDTIHFMRYVPYVLERGGKIIVAIHEAVRTLYVAPEGVKILRHGETSPPFDMHAPLMSLPHRLQMYADTPPLPNEWYDIWDYGRRDLWEGRFRLRENEGDNFRVGLVYSGNPGHKHDIDRSIPLEKLAKLAKTPAVRFFSLQKEMRPADRSALDFMPEIEDIGADFKDFRDTAAALECLDLLITVDTSVAHLAGSLGVKTWLLLPAFGTDWRWQRERTDSPWYPSMRLIRQQKRGDWDYVLNKVTKELATLATEKQAA